MYTIICQFSQNYKYNTCELIYRDVVWSGELTECFIFWHICEDFATYPKVIGCKKHLNLN